MRRIEIGVLALVLAACSGSAAPAATTTTSFVVTTTSTTPPPTMIVEPDSPTRVIEIWAPDVLIGPLGDAAAAFEIETGIEGLSVQVLKSRQETGHRFQLVLTLDPTMPKGDFSSTVKIHTTDAQNPIVEVPI